MDVYTGAHGYNLVLETELDLTDASVIKLRIKSPLGTTVTRTIPVENVEADGKVTYTVVSTDFTVPGLYRLQVSDETGEKKLTSKIFKIRSRASLEYVGS